MYFSHLLNEVFDSVTRELGYFSNFVGEGRSRRTGL